MNYASCIGSTNALRELYRLEHGDGAIAASARAVQELCRLSPQRRNRYLVSAAVACLCGCSFVSAGVTLVLQAFELCRLARFDGAGAASARALPRRKPHRPMCRNDARAVSAHAPQRRRSCIGSRAAMKTKRLSCVGSRVRSSCVDSRTPELHRLGQSPLSLCGFKRLSYVGSRARVSCVDSRTPELHRLRL